eukprot:2891881-Amphidinium_carterae.1
MVIYQFPSVQTGPCPLRTSGQGRVLVSVLRWNTLFCVRNLEPHGDGRPLWHVAINKLLVLVSSSHRIERNRHTWFA